MRNQKKCHDERRSCEPNSPAACQSICSGECCLPVLMLALSKHAIVVNSWPQQKHMPVMLQMTLYGLTSEQTTNTGDGSRRAGRQLHQIHQQQASSNISVMSRPGSQNRRCTETDAPAIIPKSRQALSEICSEGTV